MAKGKDDKITEKKVENEEKKEKIDYAKMTIYQKLGVIQKKLVSLGKDKQSGEEGKSYSYQYVSGDKLMKHLKPLLNEVGLICIQEVTDIQKEIVTYAIASGKEKKEMLYTLHFLFTWINLDNEKEKIPIKFISTGMNGMEKGLGSAITYGERYFFLKQFHIATDEDDVDSDREGSDTYSEGLKVDNKKNDKKGNEKTTPTKIDSPPISEMDRVLLLQIISVEVDKKEKAKEGYYQSLLNYYKLKDGQTLNDLSDKLLSDCANKLGVMETFAAEKKKMTTRK